jgi:transcription initiation factor IIE alpha subunit
MKEKKQLFVTIAIIVGVAVLLSSSAITISWAAGDDVYYTCPMPEHADVVMEKPGKCPKCGMDLVAKKKEAAAKYTCSMHPDVVSDKPGKCPKCGMNLVPMKDEKK